MPHPPKPAVNNFPAAQEVPPSTRAPKPQRVTTGKLIDIGADLEKSLRLAGGDGRGLHQLIGSVALPAAIRRAARTIATIRNKAAHESSFSSSELPDDFWDLVEEVNQWLTLAKQRQGLRICDLSIGKPEPAAKPAAKKAAKKTAAKAAVKKTTRK